MRNLLFLVALIMILAACSGEDNPPPTETPPIENPAEAPTGKSARPRIVFLGDSLSAGMGVDPDQAFPALIEEKIKSEGWDYVVVNAGISGDTTSGGLSRLNWLMRAPIEVLFLELGGNDGLRGLPLEVIETNLQKIIDLTRAANPDLKVVVAGMMMPPNFGARYTEGFRAIYPKLARRNEAALIPFLLEGLVGKPTLMQPDGTHPTAAGHKVIAEEVWKVLRPMIVKTSGE